MTAMANDLHYLGATRALALFRERKLSPVELMRAVIERAEVVEPRINAFSETFFERALEQAARAEARYAHGGRRARPLEGIPVAVKDEASLAGASSTSGSLLLRDAVATRTSTSVERVLRAGAIVHARTTTPEFSCAGVTHSRLWGVTRNPWNLEMSPGGSSGGSGASLAAGTSSLATGSDIWGSIRIPASCCGVVGFKPPHGRVPQDPPFNLDPYCHEGPLARSVADCALAQNVIAGPHPGDAASLRPKLRVPAAPGDVRGWRVAWSMDLGFCEIDAEVAANTRTALDAFRNLGCAVLEVKPGWTHAVPAAAMQHLGHLFGVWLAGVLEGRRELATSYARAFADFGRTTTAEGFLGAMETAAGMQEAMGPILEAHDVFVCPTTALPALPADFDPAGDLVRINGVPVDPVLGWILTYPFNMLGRCPVLSVPSGRARNGVPTGIQIVARGYDDARVFRAAAAYERERGGFDGLGERPLR
jgi:amidase